MYKFCKMRAQADVVSIESSTVSNQGELDVVYIKDGALACGSSIYPTL